MWYVERGLLLLYVGGAHPGSPVPVTQEDVLRGQEVTSRVTVSVVTPSVSPPR